MTSAEEIGVAWYNNCSEADRKKWHAAANSAVPADAYRAFCAQSAQSPTPIEVCAVCGKGEARLMRFCDTCTSEYAGVAETLRAQTVAQPAVEPGADLIDWDVLPEDASERAMFDRNLDLYGGDPRIAIATALSIWAKTHANGSFALMCAVFANEVAKMHIVPAPAPNALDAAFEAVRTQLRNLPKYSFVIDRLFGTVTRKEDRCGNWIEFDAAHKLFDPGAVEESAQKGGAA